jgi:hypothetical protein
MDGYSHVVRNIVANLNMTPTIQYIDTSFITTPLWDSAHDWCHLPPFVSAVEALYVLGAILGVLPPEAISPKSILYTTTHGQITSMSSHYDKSFLDAISATKFEF